MARHIKIIELKMEFFKKKIQKFNVDNNHCYRLQ